MNRIALFDCFEEEIKTGLKECLKLYWGYRLLELAQAHGLQIDEGTPDAEIVDQLMPKMLDNFLKDVEYLNEAEWAFLNKIKQNPNKEMDDIEKEQYITLKWLGYVYLFNNDGHIYPIIPNELSNLLHQLDKEEIKLRVEFNQRLFSYTFALTNLYGVYRIEQLVDVWNMYNKDKINVETAKDYIDAVKMRQADFWYDNGYVISRLLKDEKHYLGMLKKASRCPYFMPTKSDIAFYSNYENSMSSTHCKNVEEFIKKKNTFDEGEAADLIYDVFGACKLDIPLDLIVDMLKESGLEFSDEGEKNELMRVLRVLSNNTRKWVLRGHMPSELTKNPPITPTKQQQTKSTPKIMKKIGRNDPCYCGSGKKYKHCCSK
ncbi:MAG: zinc chelation protein SecC [Clostridiaceae bacterium]|jgi:hypothetical protein|nr:zinc chelation protein SecC [Clostridiaceae bacterium]